MDAEVLIATEERFEFGDSGHVTNEQSRTLRAMEELLARNLTHALSAWLRTSVTVSVGPQGQQVFQEFTDSLQGCYLLPLELPEQHAAALLRWPLPLAAHLIELLLGGSGAVAVEMRELTEIENSIFESVLDVVLRELNAVWGQIGLRFVPDERARNGAERHLLAPTEKTVSFTLPLEIGDLRGEISLCMAAPVLASVLRRQQATRRPANAGSERDSNALLAALQEARVRAGLCFAPVRVSAATLAALRVGSTLVLPLAANAVGELRISDVPVATAAPVRVGERRAARVSVLRDRIAVPSVLPAQLGRVREQESVA